MPSKPLFRCSKLPSVTATPLNTHEQGQSRRIKAALISQPLAGDRLAQRVLSFLENSGSV